MIAILQPILGAIKRNSKPIHNELPKSNAEKIPRKKAIFFSNWKLFGELIQFIQVILVRSAYTNIYGILKSQESSEIDHWISFERVFLFMIQETNVFVVVVVKYMNL